MNNFVYLLYRDFPFGDSYLYKIDANQAANSSFSTVSIPSGTTWSGIVVSGISQSNRIDAFLIPQNDYGAIQSTHTLQNASPTWTVKHTFGAPGGNAIWLNKTLNVVTNGSETIVTYDTGWTWTTTSVTPTSIPTGWDSSYTNSIKIQVIYSQYFNSMDFITETIYTSGFKKVYINSEDISAEDKYVILDEPMHIAAIYEDNTFNNVYLNKNTNLDGDLSATYGYISVYPNELSASDVNNRYISFLTNNVEVINKSNSIGTLAEHSGEDAIKAYSGTSKQSEI